MKNRIAITAAITKVDDDTRTIEGVATAEVVDKQGEIVDYETAKAVIAGTWPGNLREMHKSEAVGTGVVVECDDATKVIRIRGTVSKGAPNTWEKVKDGTLKMFSIGGIAKARVAEKSADGLRDVKRLFLDSVHEISLVDNGACPVAGFALAKVVGGAVEVVADDTEIEKGSAGNPRPYQVTQAAALIAALNDLLSSDVWDANYDESNAGAEGVDPAKQNEIDLLRSAIGSLLQYLQSKFAGQFPVAADGGAAVIVEVETDEVAMARMGGIAKSAIALIAAAVSKAGARHSAKDQAMIQTIHDQVVSLGGSCEPKDAEKAVLAFVRKSILPIESSDITHLQVLDRDGKPIGDKIAIDAAKAATPADDESDDDKKKKADDKAKAEQKAKADAAAKVTGDPATPAPASAAAAVGDPAPAPAEKLSATVKIADLPEVQKLIDDFKAEVEVHKATAIAQATTIADLTKRLETVEQQPAPGGPVVRVVEKQIGGPAGGGGGAVDLTPEVLTEVIKAMPEGAEKDVLLKQLLKMNAAAGVGVTKLDQRIGGRP